MPFIGRAGGKLLVTSREALNIQDEWAWRVGGLDVPQTEANIGSFAAAQLFVERARRARQDFTLIGQEAHIVRICQLVAAGRSNREIALDLVLSLNTVKSHIHHVYGKLGVESRVQAVSRARELHIL